ncbi:ribosomal L1 domain-containing protein CG13096-like [Rhopalosiphum maidis]|uniref:ribosomal L1 domain-containing protein CG13096-like n=1 Tax=Rhopalosiphum maidis TaxID=43146 RepID=UPI000EFF8B94|nr:ribosomal L1 domain-containing protein CG13096-like [Rhopalosiphum maidis]
MKVKTVPSKKMSSKKPLAGSIQKKKFSKPTGGVLKNIVKITDAFEELKSGKDLTGISCSKEPKPVKKSAAKDKIKPDGKVPKSTIDVKKKKDKKIVVEPKQKKPKKDIVEGAPKMSMKSKLLESKQMTEVNSNESEPKLDIKKVEAAVNGLFTLIKNDSNLPKNELWDEATPIHLVVTGVKIGVGPKRVVRIALPNSLITDTTDICLIVPDLVRGRNVDHEKTYHHYKDLLAKNGIKNIKTILPARQIRVEFNEYEARRNLCNSHDIFLIDQKISGFLVKKLGKEFYIKRKLPITVKLAKKHLKAEIESKLHKTSFFLDYKGSTKTVQVGHMQQTAKQVAENIVATFNNLAHSYPGGLKNIRCLLIKSPTSESLPVYYSLVSRNEVNGPYTKSKLYSKDKEVEGELFGKRVLVKPNGDVTILSGSEEESDFDDDDDDNDKIKSNKKNNQNDSEESAVEEDNEEDEQSDASIDQENEKEVINNDGLESDESEGEDGDDAEEEYLMEFEQTKKLQSKKKKKQQNEETTETNLEKVIPDVKNKNKSLKNKNNKIPKAIKKKKLNK